MQYTSRHKRILVWSLIALFATVILLNSVLFSFYRSWSIRNGGYNLANKVLLSFSICAIIILIISKLKFPAGLKWFIYSSAVLLTSISSCLMVYPIDTVTEPRDKVVLIQASDGWKLVLREYKNAKTNTVLRDTVVAKDVFIFRKILKRFK